MEAEETCSILCQGPVTCWRVAVLFPAGGVAFLSPLTGFQVFFLVSEGDPRPSCRPPSSFRLCPGASFVCNLETTLSLQLCVWWNPIGKKGKWKGANRIFMCLELICSSRRIFQRHNKMQFTVELCTRWWSTVIHTGSLSAHCTYWEGCFLSSAVWKLYVPQLKVQNNNTLRFFKHRPPKKKEESFLDINLFVRKGKFGFDVVGLVFLPDLVVPNHLNVLVKMNKINNTELWKMRKERKAVARHFV